MVSNRFSNSHHFFCQGLAALDKEVVDFQTLKAEELNSLQEYKDEEMKKLR